MIDSTKYDEKELFPPIIAVDFDGTLVENKFPEIGEINIEVWKAIEIYKEKGWKIILWTCRTDSMLKDAVEFCEKNGLVFDAVNENIPEVQSYYGGDTRKVFANKYIDDRSSIVFIEKTGETKLTDVSLIWKEK